MKSNRYFITFYQDRGRTSIKYLLKSNNQEDIDVTLLHENAYAYRGHAAKPGTLHSDFIEEIIAFVDRSERELATDCRIL